MTGASEIDRAIARKPIVSGPTDRSFGLTFAVILTALGAYLWLSDGAPPWWAFGMAAALAAIAAVRPALLAPFNRWWLRFGLLLHRIVNPVVLGAMFFLIITPAGLLMRLVRRPPILARRDPGAVSYWVPRTPPGPDPASMRRQF